ncbi:very short patch repair endonuclease [Bradyrhizobium sp. SZCCHNS2015]|uniref:very short patch repair endonuclease n=1 Tax=Bradyrhizobium sp. SZCCHNS2015 TaxID=3057305 RepID=UPI0028ED17BC|nr:very short patch repair endonuclease [Bradyrhizobium sp. SZCCHNS2015]
MSRKNLCDKRINRQPLIVRAVDPARSRLMSRVRQKDTGPELVVRSLAHSLGYRFRLHRRDLPGSPDIVFISRRKIILVHGCFWHRHTGCPKSTTPKTRREFWQAKFKTNRRRDKAVIERLIDLGWKVLVIWECEVKDLNSLKKRLRRFLK